MKPSYTRVFFISYFLNWIKLQMELSKISRGNIIPLIAAASAQRRMNELKVLIIEAKRRKITFRKLYEALLQNYLFVGYPSALLSLKLLKEMYPHRTLLKAADMNLYHFSKRGETNCKKIYGDKYDKLIMNVEKFSPDLAEWLVLEGYGKVIGRKGLSLRERELSIIAVLTVLKFKDQLYSHINGAYRTKSPINRIQSVIESLSLFGNKNLSLFGLKMLNKYRKEKGM